MTINNCKVLVRNTRGVRIDNPYALIRDTRGVKINNLHVLINNSKENKSGIFIKLRQCSFKIFLS